MRPSLHAARLERERRAWPLGQQRRGLDVHVEQPAGFEGPLAAGPDLDPAVLEGAGAGADEEPALGALPLVEIQAAARGADGEGFGWDDHVRQHAPGEAAGRVAPEPADHAEIAAPEGLAVDGAPAVVAPQAVVGGGVEPEQPVRQARFDGGRVAVVGGAVAHHGEQHEQRRDQHREDEEGNVDDQQEKVLEHGCPGKTIPGILAGDARRINDGWNYSVFGGRPQQFAISWPRVVRRRRWRSWPVRRVECPPTTRSRSGHRPSRRR